MKKVFHVRIVCLLLFMCMLHTARSQSKDFSALHSLTGTWIMQTKKGWLYESWWKVNDSTLKSRSFRVSGTDTVFLETIELVKRGENILYIATVPDQNDHKPVPFTLVKWDNNTYVFENAQHDFPQRVIYVLPENDSMHAWIEGNVNGQLRKNDFMYTRSK